MEIKPIEKGKYEDEEVLVDDVSITYLQNGDCTEEDNNVQSITISTRNNGCDRFISIKSEGWSISNENELVNLFKDFKNRAGLCTE